jgi:hypothetical protein
VRLLLSGSGGFIGKQVFSHFVEKGYEVVCLQRKSPDIFDWDLPPNDFDVVIHLAGEPIFARWTKEKKRKILLSRSLGTTNLVVLLLKNPPKVFISASAIGFYGDRGEEVLDEESSSGSGFLPKVCREWEMASAPLEVAGTRVVHARFGVVIGKGGLLQKCRSLYKMGLGGTLGSGNQWLSWIALKDLVRALDFCSEHPEIKGAINLVSPHSIRQKDFANLLAKSLHRPAFFHLPASFLKILLGDMAKETLLSSQHVLPKKLQNRHFSFEVPQFKDAILCP